MCYRRVYCVNQVETFYLMEPAPNKGVQVKMMISSLVLSDEPNPAPFSKELKVEAFNNKAALDDAVSLFHVRVDAAVCWCWMTTCVENKSSPTTKSRMKPLFCTHFIECTTFQQAPNKELIYCQVGILVLHAYQRTIHNCQLDQIGLLPESSMQSIYGWC